MPRPGRPSSGRKSRRRVARPLVWRLTGWVLAALAASVLAVQLWFAAHVLYWRQANPAMTSFMAARLDELRASNPKARLAHRWVEYRHISPHLKRAVVAAEDARFVDHEGFDWEGIQRAMDRNLKRGRVVAGGSTITQQLAKNLFLSRERSYLRKAQEAVIAVMLEAFMDKRRILEIYLNVVEWGDDIFGAEAAARHYFGVSAAQLGPAQAAHLAAMLPRPRHYQRNRHSPYLERYAAVIQDRMAYVRIP